MSDESERRDVLEATGALVSAGAISGLSGCLGGVLGGDEGTDDERSDPPTFSLDSWITEPGAVTGEDHYPFEYVSYDAFLELEATLGEGPLDEDDFAEIEAGTNGEGDTPRPLPALSGRPIETFTDYLTVDNNAQQVLYGDHAPDAIGEGLVEDVGFEEVDEHEEFTIYLSEFSNQPVDVAVGLSDFVLLWIEAEEPVEDVTALADSQSGETPLYADANEDLAELLDYVGDGARVHGETSDPASQTDIEFPVFEGQVGYGYDLDLDGDPIDETYAFVFEDESAVERDAVEEWVERGEEGGRFDAHTTVSTEQDGRTVVVTGSRETVDPFVDPYE